MDETNPNDGPRYRHTSDDECARCDVVASYDPETDSAKASASYCAHADPPIGGTDGSASGCAPCVDLEGPASVVGTAHRRPITRQHHLKLSGTFDSKDHHHLLADVARSGLRTAVPERFLDGRRRSRHHGCDTVPNAESDGDDDDDCGADGNNSNNDDDYTRVNNSDVITDESDDEDDSESDGGEHGWDATGDGDSSGDDDDDCDGELFLPDRAARKRRRTLSTRSAGSGDGGRPSAPGPRAARAAQLPEPEPGALFPVEILDAVLNEHLAPDHRGPASCVCRLWSAVVRARLPHAERRSRARLIRRTVPWLFTGLVGLLLDERRVGAAAHGDPRGIDDDAVMLVVPGWRETGPRTAAATAATPPASRSVPAPSAKRKTARGASAHDDAPVPLGTPPPSRALRWALAHGCSFVQAVAAACLADRTDLLEWARSVAPGGLDLSRALAAPDPRWPVHGGHRGSAQATSPSCGGPPRGRAGRAARMAAHAFERRWRAAAGVGTIGQTALGWLVDCGMWQHDDLYTAAARARSLAAVEWLVDRRDAMAVRYARGDRRLAVPPDIHASRDHVYTAAAANDDIDMLRWMRRRDFSPVTGVHIAWLPMVSITRAALRHGSERALNWIVDEELADSLNTAGGYGDHAGVVGHVRAVRLRFGVRDVLDVAVSMGNRKLVERLVRHPVLGTVLEPAQIASVITARRHCWPLFWWAVDELGLVAIRESLDHAAGQGLVEHMDRLVRCGVGLHESAMAAAARHGRIAALDRLRDLGCPWTPGALFRAALAGYAVESLRWVTAQGHAPTEEIMRLARERSGRRHRGAPLVRRWWADTLMGIRTTKREERVSATTATVRGRS